MGWELVSSVGERARTCTGCYARGCCRALTRARACRFILLSLREWLTCHVRRMHVHLSAACVGLCAAAYGTLYTRNSSLYTSTTYRSSKRLPV